MSDTPDKARILARLKKLKARAECKGSAQSEVESAKKIMAALMEEFGISDQDLAATEAHEARAKASAADKPPTWETRLVSRICRIFGCETIRDTRLEFANGRIRKKREWVFIGTGSAPEVAGYAFDVLFRMCTAARKRFCGLAATKKLIPKTRLARADLYCVEWIIAATEQLTAWERTVTQSQAIAAYRGVNYPDLSDLETRDRNSGRNLRPGDYDAARAGRRDGQAANVNRGVAATGKPAKAIGRDGGHG